MRCALLSKVEKHSVASSSSLVLLDSWARIHQQATLEYPPASCCLSPTPATRKRSQSTFKFLYYSLVSFAVLFAGEKKKVAFYALLPAELRPALSSSLENNGKVGFGLLGTNFLRRKSKWRNISRVCSTYFCALLVFSSGCVPGQREIPVFLFVWPLWRGNRG